MADGIRASNLPVGATLSEFIGLETTGGVSSLKRFDVDAVFSSHETVLDPEGEIKWKPVSSSYGPFRADVAANSGNPRLYLCYNMTPDGWALDNVGERGLAYGMETDYDDGSGHNKMEMYWQYQYISGGGDASTNTYRRSIMAQWDKVTNLPTVLFLGSAGNLGIQFCHNDGTGSVAQEQVVGKAKMQMNATNFDVWNQPGGTTKALEVNSADPAAASGLQVLSAPAGAGIHLTATSTGTNESLYLDAKGGGPIILNSISNTVISGPTNGYSFNADLTTSAYLFSAGIMGISAGGVNVLKANGSATNAATGLDIISQAATFGTHLKVTSSGSNEGLYLDAKGAAPVVLNQDGGGVVLIPDAGVSFTSDQTTGFYLSGANVCAVRAGNIPILTINGAATSRGTGLQVTSAASGSRASLSVTSTGTNEGVDIDAKGSGTIRLGQTSTGNIILARDAATKKFNAGYTSANGLGATVTNDADMTGSFGYDYGIIERAVGATSWYFASFKSAAGSDSEFLFRGDGTAFCDGAWTGGGADYAEYFEWADGNPAGEDRRGISVVMVDDKIRPATATDVAADVLGIVSARPTVVGDAAEMRWKDKYQRDVYGQEIYESATMLSWTDADGQEHRYFADSLPEDITAPSDAVQSTEQRKVLNPDYDPTLEYVPRSQRKEWSAVGLMGKLALRTGQPVGANWRKMKALSADVDLWLVR
jgi:hypothetical protein